MINFRSPINNAPLAVLSIATVAGTNFIPETAAVVVRWGLDLQPTQTLPKFQALIQMPIATAALWAVFWLIQRYGNRERHGGQARALAIGLPLLTSIVAIAQIAIVVVALRSA